MSTYADLQDRINLDYLNRTDLINETKRSIRAAIRFYERKRFWFNETSTAITSSAGQRFVSLPSDFLVLDLLQITVSSADYALKQQDMNWIRGVNSTRSQGQPTDFAIYQNRIELSAIPNSAYSLQIYYIHQLPALSADTDSNAWTSGGAEDLITYHAAKLMLATHLGVPEKAIAFAQLERSSFIELQSINEQKINFRLRSN